MDDKEKKREKMNICAITFFIIGLLFFVASMSALVSVRTNYVEKDESHYNLMCEGYNYCPYCGEKLNDKR